MTDFPRVEDIMYVLFFLTVYDASLRELLLTKIILPIDLYSNRKENKKDRLRGHLITMACVSPKRMDATCMIIMTPFQYYY